MNRKDFDLPTYLASCKNRSAVTYDFLYKTLWRALKKRKFAFMWELMNTAIVWRKSLGPIIYLKDETL